MTDSDNPHPTDTAGDPHLDSFPKLLLPASRTLRGALGIDEETFRRHTFHGAPRDFVFWTALDEVEKTAMVLTRLHEFLGDEPIKVATPADSTTRTAIAIVLEEERLRARRLCELLTELVLFGQKDEDAYYSPLPLAQRALLCIRIQRGSTGLSRGRKRVGKSYD